MTGLAWLIQLSKRSLQKTKTTGRREVRDWGGRGCTGIKPNHSKEIRLAGKAECSWHAFPPVGKQACQQSSPVKGKGLVSKGQTRLALPHHRLHVPLQSGAWIHGQEQGVRPWRRMCHNQHGFGEVQSGSLYGRCYMHTDPRVHSWATSPYVPPKLIQPRCLCKLYYLFPF